MATFATTQRFLRMYTRKPRLCELYFDRNTTYFQVFVLVLFVHVVFVSFFCAHCPAMRGNAYRHVTEFVNSTIPLDWGGKFGV